MALDEMAMLIDGRKPAVTQRLTGVAGEQARTVATQKLPSPCPIEQTDAELEAADPRLPPRVRTLPQPRVDQRAATFQVALVAREMPGLRQIRELEMPIDLPEIF